MKRAKLVLVACAVLVLAAACAWRIYDVNAQAIRYPTERYGVGEDVPLEGCFFSDDSEATDGYVIRVEQAELMSYNEYVSAYGMDGAQTVEGADVPSVICLTVNIANNSDKGADEAGFNIIGMGMTKPNGDSFMRVDRELWALSEPAVADSAQSMRMGVLPHSSYTTHMPFTAGILVGETFSGEVSRPVDDLYYQRAEEGRYDLHLSVQPKRKLVEIDV